MTLILPIPPSTNRMWRNWRGRMVLSAEGRAYKKEVAQIASLARVKPIGGTVAVQVYIYRARKARDLDNFLKCSLDAVQGYLYDNDSQIRSLVAWMTEDKANPRIEITVAHY